MLLFSFRSNNDRMIEESHKEVGFPINLKWRLSIYKDLLDATNTHEPLTKFPVLQLTTIITALIH